MKVPFVKYQGAGNDFVMIDDRKGVYFPMVTGEWIAKVCHRRFGIGADGLIILQKGQDGADYFMKYFNADGRTSTFCGNGGRCIVAFAASLGIHHGESRFLGTDGWHMGWSNGDGQIRLSMLDVNQIKEIGDDAYSLYTGSPHYVKFISVVSGMDVFTEGRKIRCSEAFVAEGINVNFVQSINPVEINIRTYERGVEDETMACGTGVVASAIANAFRHDDFSGHCIIHAAGGNLTVTFQREGKEAFKNVMLIGPATKVFEGEIEID